MDKFLYYSTIIEFYIMILMIVIGNIYWGVTTC